MLVIAATARELGKTRNGVACGVGPVDAAAVTAAVIAERRPRAVLHVGLAGVRGYMGPELVIGSDAVYCDSDSNLVTKRVDPDPVLLARARSAFPGARVCTIGMSGSVGGTTGVDVEAMEGFSVLRACGFAGVPAIEVRAVCNDVDEPDRSKWEFEKALTLLHDAIPHLLVALDG
ncbi:unannotated protein [freshwater metagenome]|uniref:Unannotated protein n=1 Tax=freshwater metagenome TaxID=449393 RepID=A0A6J6PPS1_9ZZZZ